MDGVVGNVLLEVIQYWFLSLQWQNALIAFRYHSHMEVIAGPMQIGRFDDCIGNDLENLLPHPLDRHHGLMEK